MTDSTEPVKRTRRTFTAAERLERVKQLEFAIHRTEAVRRRKKVAKAVELLADVPEVVDQRDQLLAFLETSPLENT